MLYSAIGSASGAAAVSAIAVTTAAANVLPAVPVKRAVTEPTEEGENTATNAKGAQVDDGDATIVARTAAATSSSRVLAALTLLKFGG